MSKPGLARLPALSCETCGGEGFLYKSRYGGNDPDVWRAGNCEACKGSGVQVCEDCGEADAVRHYVDPRNPRNKFAVCKACFDEWAQEDLEE